MEQPDEFESESVHSTGNGRENNVRIFTRLDIFHPYLMDDNYYLINNSYQWNSPMSLSLNLCTQQVMGGRIKCKAV